MPLIRPATPKDAATMSRIHALSWKAAYGDILPQAGEIFFNGRSISPKRLPGSTLIFICSTSSASFGPPPGGRARQSI